jgi:glycosyltransferase involved in cell wall biosynthesis
MRQPGASASAPGAPPQSAGPLFPEVGVVAVVAEPWGGMWLSRQQILSRLARYFHVVWVDPPRGWREVWRARGARPIGLADATPPPASGFSVYRHGPLLPRFFKPRLLQEGTERARLRRARAVLSRRGCRRVLLYLWRPEFAPALDQVAHDVSCYHIADEYTFADVEAPVSELERSVIARVDQVFIHSPALMEKKGGINPRTAQVTNGVDYAAFAADAPEPADLSAVPRPRVGYVGRIKVQLEWDLLAALAQRRPEWSFVFIGPLGFLGERRAQQEALFARPNVHYLGAKPVGEIPGYTRHVDVGLLSYALNNYTRYIFPLKLHEFLAAGRPVVGSDIRSLRDFEGVVRIARSVDEWDAAIAAALAPEAQGPAAVEQRRRVARRYDWGALVERIAGTLCERLGGEYPDRFRALAGAPRPE